MNWYRVGMINEIPERKIWPIHVNHTDIFLLRAGEQIFAYLDQCSHQDIKLSEFGDILPNGQLICYAHGACFDLPSGAPLCFPAEVGLKTFPIKIESQEVLVQLPI